MKLKVVSLVSASLLLFCGVAAAANGGDSKNGENDAKKQLKLVQDVTKKYKDVEAALKDGYEATDVLVPNMGYHYAKPSLIDDKVNPLEPEVIIYEPKSNGDLRLVAVEYISTTANKLFGVDFDPPGGIPFYSLHAWIYSNNPDGIFTPFNPKVANVDHNHH